jgi:hypothetical protein
LSGTGPFGVSYHEPGTNWQEREMQRTPYDKIFDAHVVRAETDGRSHLYVDRHHDP